MPVVNDGKDMKPKYKGPRKGYASVWLGNINGEFDIIRIIHSQPIQDARIINSTEINKTKYTWNCDEKFLLKPWYQHVVYKCCWSDMHKTEAWNIKKMHMWDKQRRRETVFLGYVKDKE